jgi:hypothetical protein
MRAVPFAYFAKQAQEAQLSYNAIMADDAYFAYDAYTAYTLYSPYNDAVSFTNPSNSFSGDGSGLTNLSASNIGTGTLTAHRGGTGVDPATLDLGSMLISLSSGWYALPPGANGQVLKMVAGFPTWTNEATSGRLSFNHTIAGMPSNPTGATGFITTPCTVTVSSYQQLLNVVATISINAFLVAGGQFDGGVSLSLVIKNASTGSESILDATFATFKAPERKQFVLHAQNSTAPGTYYIGIKGYRDPAWQGSVTPQEFKQSTLLFD